MPFNEIDQENTRQEILSYFLTSFSADLGGLMSNQVGDLILSNIRITILDLNGEDLFDEIAVEDNSSNIIGAIRTTSNSRDLPVIDSIILGNSVVSNKDLLIQRSFEAFNRDFPEYVPEDPQFVCYGYPYIGVRFTVESNNSKSYLLYNPYQKLLKSRWAATSDLSDIDSSYSDNSDEGEPFYSIINHLNEAGNDEILNVNNQWSSLLVETILGTTEVAASHSNIDYPFSEPNIPIGKFLQKNRILSNNILHDDIENFPQRISAEGKVLPVRLIAQTEGSYCVPTCAEMILNYIGITDVTQEEIAQRLNTTVSGTRPDALDNNLKGLANNTISVSTIQKPTFIDIKNNFNLIPIKSGIPRHARIIRGWKEYNFIGRDGRISHSEKFLLINDPQPVNGGLNILENTVKPINGFYNNATICSYIT